MFEYSKGKACEYQLRGILSHIREVCLSIVMLKTHFTWMREMNNIQQGLENHPQFDSADVWLSGLMFKKFLCAFVECIVAIFVGHIKLFFRICRQSSVKTLY